MNKKDANTKISQWLIGSVIDRLTYFITGWKLSLVSENHEVQSVCSEIK